MLFCGRGKAEGTYRSNLGYLICFVWLWEHPRDVLKENVGVHGIMQTAVIKTEASTHIVYAVLICINFIKMIRPGISYQSYVGIKALSGTRHILLLVAFVVSSLSLPVLHVHLLPIIQMIFSPALSSHPFSTMLCQLSPRGLSFLQQPSLFSGL
jgi:hypothetical protein